MSKLSFRSRQLDVNRHILIYRHEEFGKISDFTKSSRSVAPIPSGMEKEEESEYHLQQAIQSQKVTVKGVVIPTPSVESGTDYDLFYKGNFPLPKQFIHIQPFDLEDNLPEYDMDSEDEEWLNIVNSSNRNGNTENAKSSKSVAKTNGLSETAFITPDVFERLMDTFEKASGHQMISYDEAKVLIKNENEDVLRIIYVYWHKKRFIKGMNLTPQILTEKRIMAIPPTQSLSQQLSNINSSITASITSTSMGQTKQNGKPLITHLSAAEKKLSLTANTSSISQHDNSNPATNPYIAFRRRAEKMQTRKNRKNDEYSYEKMLKLKRDLIRAQKIFELVEKRESFKTDLVNIAQNTFKTRFALQDFSGDTYRETKRLYNTTNNNNMLYEESPISPLKNYSYPYGLDSYYYTNNAYSAIHTSPFKEQFEWGLDFKKRTLSPTKAMSSSTTNKRQSNSLRKQNKNHDYLGVLEDERHNIQNRSFSISSTSQHPRSKRQGAHPPLRYTRDYDSSSLASSTSNIHSEIHYNNTNNHNANNKRKILTTLMKTSSSNASHNQQQDPYYYYYYHPGGGSGNQHLENMDDEFYPSSTMAHNKKRKITSSMITPTQSQMLPHNKRMRKGSGETDQQYYNNTKIKISSSPYASPTTNKTIPPPYNTVDGIVGAMRKVMYLNPYPMNGETTNPLILLLQLERLKRIRHAFYNLNNTPKAKMEDDNKTTTLIENHYSPTMAKSRIRKLFMALHIPHVSRENSPTETPVVHDSIAKTTLENPISTAIAVVEDHKLISSDYDRRIRVFFAALERALYQNMYSQSTSTNDGMTSGKNVEQKNDDIFKNDHYKVAHRLYPHIYYTYSWLDYFYGTFHDTHLTTAIIHTPFTYSPAINRKTTTAKQNDQQQNNRLFVTNTPLNYSNLHNIPSMFDVNVSPKRLNAPNSIVDMMGRVKSNIPKRLKHTPTCLRTYFKRNTQLHLSKMLSNTSSYQSQQPPTSQLLQNSPALLNIGPGGTKVCLPLSTPLQYHNNHQMNHANDNNINNYAYLGNDNNSFAIPHNYHTLYNSYTTTSHPQTKHVINASIPNSGLHNTSHKMLGNILVPRSLTTTPSNLHTIYNNNTSSLNNNGTNNNFVYYSESLSKQQQQQYIVHPSNNTNSSAGYYSYNLTNNNPVLKSMFESPAPMSATTIYLNQNGSTISSIGLTTPTYATVNSDTITPTNIHNNNNGNRYFSVNNRSTINTTLSNLSFTTTYSINSQNINASYQLGATNLTTAPQLHNTQNSTPNVALRGIFSSQNANMPTPSTVSQSQFLPQQFLLIKQSLASGTSNLSNNSLIVQQQQYHPHQLTTKSQIQLLANADSPAIPVNYNVNTSTYFFAAHNLNAANNANNPSTSSSIRHKVNNTAGLPSATSNKRPSGANESGQPQQQISQLQRIIPSTSTSQYMVLNVADLSNIKYISVSGSQSPSFIIVTDNSSHTLSTTTTTSTTPSIKLAPHPQQILGVGNANFNCSTNNHHLSNLMQVKLGTNNQILNVAPPSNNHSMAPSEATVTLIGDYILLPPQTQYNTFNSYNNRNLQKSVQNVYMTSSSSSHNSTISSSLLGSHSHLESAVCNTAFNNTGNIGSNSVNNNSTYMLITNNQISPINFNNNNKSHTPSITSLSANKYYNNTLLTQTVGPNKSLHHEVETRDVQTLNRIHISNIATNNVNNNANQITVTSSITHNIINNLATNNLFKLVSISNNNANNSPNLNAANHLIQNVNHINSGGTKSLTPIVMATQQHQSNTYITGSAVGNINLLRPSPGNVHAKQQIINPININLTSLSNNNNNFIVINREGLSKLNVSNNNPGGLNKTLNLLGNGGIGINQQYSSNKFFVSGTSNLTTYKENQTLSPIILPMTTTNSSGLTTITPSMNSILANRNASSLHMANASTKLSNASLIANNATIYNTNNLNQKYKTLSLLIPSTTNTNLNSNNAYSKNIVLSHSTNVQSIGGPSIVGAGTPQKYTVILQQPNQTPVNAQPTASEFSMVSLPSSLNKSQNIVATPTTNCGNSSSVGPSPTPTTTSSFSPTIVNLFAIT